jgi:hypothetical protein
VAFGGPGPTARPHGCPEVEPCGRLRHPGIVAIGPAPIHARPNAGQLAFGLWPVHVLDRQIPVLVGWAGHRPGGERNRAVRRSLAQARPRPCFRAGDEIGPQRVAFSIADDGMEGVPDLAAVTFSPGFLRQTNSSKRSSRQRMRPAISLASLAKSTFGWHATHSISATHDSTRFDWGSFARSPCYSMCLTPHLPGGKRIPDASVADRPS